MTHSSADLLDLAVPYALNALSDAERAEVEGLLADVGLAVADAFYDEVRAAREIMAVVSAAGAEEPPTELRDRLMSAIDDDLADVAHYNDRNYNVRNLRSARLRGYKQLLPGLEFSH